MALALAPVSGVTVTSKGDARTGRVHAPSESVMIPETASARDEGR
jgi:hypothetical protein